MNEMIEKLRKHLEENPDSFINYMKAEQDFENRCKNKVGSYIESIEPHELEEELDKFFKWEKKYEDMQYKRGTLTHSNIFFGLVSYIEDVRDRYMDLDEDFLAKAFLWKNYVFKLYIGQGSFWTIEKDGERIFTTT